MKFEFTHGNRMLYITAETPNDKRLFRELIECRAEILGSNIKNDTQKQKWFAITFPVDKRENKSDDWP